MLNLFNSLYLNSETLNSLSYLLDDGYLVKQSIENTANFKITNILQNWTGNSGCLELATCEQFSETVLNMYIQVSNNMICI